MKRVVAFLGLPAVLMIGALVLLASRWTRPVRSARVAVLAGSDSAGSEPPSGRPPIFTARSVPLPDVLRHPPGDEPGPAPPSPERTQAVFLQGSFTFEGKDGAWSASAARELDNALRVRAGQATRVSPVECRRTMCRVTISDGSREHLGRYLREALVDAFPPVWKGAWFFDLPETAGPDGTMTGTLYLAREGRDLPRPPPRLD